jgi:hypothetical protein
VRGKEKLSPRHAISAYSQVVGEQAHAQTAATGPNDPGAKRNLDLDPLCFLDPGCRQLADNDYFM